MSNVQIPSTDIPDAPWVVTISDYDQYFYIGFNTFAEASDYTHSSAPHDWYRAMTADIAPHADIVSMRIDGHYRVDVEIFDADDYATGDFAHLCLRATNGADAMWCAQEAGFDAFDAVLVPASESESGENVWCVLARKE